MDAPTRIKEVRTVLISTSVSVPHRLGYLLLHEAGKRGKVPVDLLAEILVAVLEDNMIGAILDDGR